MFELVNQRVEFSAFFGGERTVVPLSEKFRHAFSLAGIHAEPETEPQSEPLRGVYLNRDVAYYDVQLRGLRGE